MARLLSLSLAGLTADERLASVYLLGVEPGPDAARLRVRVAVRDPEIEPMEALASLEAARGLLRSEIAAGIRRRRAPDLVFVVGDKGREQAGAP